MKPILPASLLFLLCSAQGTYASVRIVTLNTAKVTDSAAIVREIQADTRLRGADIFLLQEVAQAAGRRGSAADEVAEARGMRVAYAPAAPGVSDQGLAIVSRYPLREVRLTPLCRYDLLWHSRVRFALTSTVETPDGAVRISNAHLDTRVNAEERVRQLSDALKDDDADAPRILAGDFNTNNFYWLAHALPLPYPGGQTGAVRRFLEKRGFVSAIPDALTTFDYLGMHLDWVFARGLRTRAMQVIPMAFSDHHAVWVELARVP